MNPVFYKARVEAPRLAYYEKICYKLRHIYERIHPKN